MKALCIIVICISSLGVTAQSDSSGIIRNQLKIALPKLLTEVRGIFLSYERWHNNRHATQLTVGYICDLLSSTAYASRFAGLAGYAVELEEKLYNKKKGNVRSFASAELAALTCTFSLGNTAPQGAPDPVTVVHRNTCSLNFKAGVQFYRNRFVGEFAAGFGARYRDVWHTGGTPLLKPSMWDFTSRKGREFAISFPVSVKLGFMF